MIRLIQFLLRLLYGYRVENASVLNTPGPVLLLPNHSSWWDWLLIGACLETDWKFVTSIQSAETSWFHKRVMVNGRTFPVDMTSAYAVKHMAEFLQKGGRLVLFPEGRLSRTGSLMKLFDGTGFLIFKTHAKVITAYLRGAHTLPLSPSPGAKRWFPRLSVHLSECLMVPSVDHSSVTAARALLTDWLRDQMIKLQFETETRFGPANVPEAIMQAARAEPAKVIIQDVTMQKLRYRRLLAASSLLAGQWRPRPAAGGDRIGVLLPNTNAVPVLLLSLWRAGVVPAVLNYSSGVITLLACARLAGLKRIVTSKVFFDHLKFDAEAFKSAGIELVFLEEIRARISGFDKLRAVFAQLFRVQAADCRWKPEETAVVLFTSGSEGQPKGVELTHRNLLANIQQMLAVIDLWETDRFFNALPLFHSFGLTIGLLLPLIHRVFVFVYLSPLHYRVVPSAFYNLDCTVLFGTNTFLGGYARKANPYDFHRLRYVFAGAEKLQEGVTNLWSRKFGVRIIEGYGATECSPCVSANTPHKYRQGSVGHFLPGIEHKLEVVEGIETLPESEKAAGESVGRLFVRGPNIMRGYLNPEANAAFKSLGGWYDTGDIAKVDAGGFLHLLGRLKRFAKISGEMVSLTAVEEALAGAFPQFGLRFAAAVVTKPDETKGEKLILVTNESKLTLEQVREAIHNRGLTNLAVPREIKVVREIPLLGTGKTNHRELETMV